MVVLRRIHGVSSLAGLFHQSIREAARLPRGELEQQLVLLMRMVTLLGPPLIRIDGVTRAH